MASALRRPHPAHRVGGGEALPADAASLRDLVEENTARHWRTDLATATDVRAFDAGPGVRILAYWSDVPRVGKGPSASVYVREERGVPGRRLRQRPGPHARQPRPDRLCRRGPRGSSSRRRIWTIRSTGGLFEIARNTPAARGAQTCCGGLRRCPIDPTALARAAEEVGAHWLLLADRHMGDRAQPDRARTSTDAKARQAAG